MSSDYKTPKRHTSSKAVDLITGKEKVEYFFDPALLIPEQTPRTPKRNDSSQSLSILSHKHLFSPCTIVKKDESHTLTKTSDGTLYKLASDEMTQLTAEDRQGLEDVLHLPNISEPSLLHTLRVRYHRDEIYTNAGPILISINPYKTIMKQNSSIYSDSVMAAYRKNRCSAPHLFTIADRAYNALLTKNKNQSIIISGESGAGKTEATKIIMQYLAKTSHTRNTSQLEQQVLSSSPLLESFGNARTLRNDNSSRFGKFIQIKFQNGHISGATIRNYLLEKTRIVQQIEGERNYHIFYQILSDKSLSEELGLHDAEGLNYLSKKYVKSKRDEKGLEETRECLKNIGLDDDDVKVIFQVVAGVLHLGNVSFIVAGENEKASIADGESQRSLEMGCKMLGMDANEVSKAILTKVLNVGGKTITQDQNVAQATDKRDALAKLVYSSLFLWLVSRINATIDRVHSPDDILSPSSTFSFDFNDSDGLSSIGVLDIYGFEQFDVNGFEQLLINYANEKLQRHFNKHLFEVEQELYSHEGVDWTYITFNDNKACLDLIEGGSGSVGILGTLDDAWSGMGSGNEKDVKFVSQLHQFFGGVQETSASVKKMKGKSEGRHDNFRMPKFANDKDFIVIHYAGEVRYTAHGFVEKNVESLSNEMKSLGMTSSSELCRDIFTYFSDEISNLDNSSSNRTRSTIRGVSIASQFKASLQNLVGDLEETEPHYVRCIKPNLKKASNDFDAGEVLRQLRYAGMLEAIRIRREGYALREPHESFYNKFHILFDSVDLKEGEGIEHLVKVLSKRLSVNSVDWQIGHSKIFLRRELAAKLNALMSLRIRSAARTLGRYGRHVAHRSAGRFITSWARFRLHMRQKYKTLRASIKIQSLYRQWNQRKTYEICIQAIITIQSNIRMALAMKALKRLMDPYRDMTYIEVRELYRAEEQCLEYAVATKDYELAAEIEKNMIPLKEALEKKRPLSRALIEKMINDIEAELKEALAKKRYNDCPPLQQKIDELHEKRKYYPTVDELRQMVSQAEQAVDEAAAKRDFTGAAERQINVEKAKRRLAEAIAAEEESDEELSIPLQPELNMFSSRLELEEKIREIKADIEKAIQSKKFNVASSLQEELNDLEARRSDFPTVLELEQRCRSKESEMAEAIAKKYYSRAASLQEDIDSLQECIKREKSVRENQLNENNEFSSTDNCVSATLPNGVILQFYCRTELDFAISEYVAKVDESAMQKNFTDAKQNQEIVNQLEILRPLLPTMQDLEEEEKQLSYDLQNAIKAKDYGKAENLQIKIQEVKTKISIESHKNNSLNSKITKLNGTKEKARTPIAKLSQHNTIMIDKHNDTKHDYKTVLRLRPKKPLVSNAQDSVLTVAQMLANKRSSASIVIGADGSLAGIITDTDITRRLVARDLNASKTNVTKIMTSNPTVVSVDDPAMEALGIMVENHFRHLPVVDDRGSVVGVLDIAKCLNDAISKLERAEEQKNSAAEDAVKQMAAMQGAGGQQAAMLTQLLAPLMAQAFGNKASPTLRSLLAGKPATIVSPDTSLKETATVMSEARKAALVVENGKLVGIFGFKDMMSRAVAKELPLEHTEVSEVMTPDPESVSPDITVIEALQIMHENKFLNLPVCEKDGTVCGLVGVMDLMYGCGGAEGWRSLFYHSFGVASDDASDTASYYSAGSKSLRTSRSVKSSRVAKSDEKPVSKLRPKKPLVSNVQDSVLTVAQMLANKRSSASIVIGADGNLAGIITDTDITRRLVARDLNASNTNVTKIMTSNPSVVSVDDPAMEALGIMVENHFRHLPVVDDRGSVVGVLDIAKCLNDAISKLERAEEQKNSAAEDAVKQMAAMQGAGGQQAAMLTQLLAPLMAQAFGNKASPTLRSLLAGKPATIVSPDTSLKETATVMSEARKAALVVEDGKLVGIFGFKDMMSRAVAKELPLEHTEVREVMTPDPESVSPDITVIEALQIMHENKFLNLPVCEKDGTVCGLVGVMDLIYGCGGAEGWRSLFDVAFEFDQDRSKGDAVPTNFSETSPSFLATKSPFIISNPDNIPNHVEFKDDDQDSMGDSLLDRTLSYPIHSPDRTSAVFGEISFKLTDSKGHRYLIRSDGKLDNLLKAIFQKVGGEINDVHNVRLKFIDAEGDEINITSDECLSEAIMLSRKNGDQGVKLILSIIPKDGGSGTSPKVFVTIGGVIALLVLGIATMTLHRRSK